MNRILVLLLVLVLLAACCVPVPRALTPRVTATDTPGSLPPADPPTAGRVEDAERRWQAGGVSDYRIVVREVHSTWCYYDVAVEVQRGEVVSGTVTAHPGPASDCGLYAEGVVEEPVSLAPAEAARWTVPGLFQIAREWQALAGREHMGVVLEFDASLGYPTALSRDNEAAVDDDTWLQTLEFTRVE